MNFQHIHHVAILTSDYKKTKEFYVEKLGFEVIRENYREERDDYKIDLRLGDSELEVFVVKNAPARPKIQNFGLVISAITPGKSFGFSNSS